MLTLSLEVWKSHEERFVRLQNIVSLFRQDLVCMLIFKIVGEVCVRRSIEQLLSLQARRDRCRTQLLQCGAMVSRMVDDLYTCWGAYCDYCTTCTSCLTMCRTAPHICWCRQAEVIQGNLTIKLFMKIVTNGTGISDMSEELFQKNTLRI